MESEEVRAVIKFFHLKGYTPPQIKAELDEVLSNSSPSLRTVCRWVDRFNSGNLSTQRAPCPVREKKPQIEENVKKVKEIVLEDRRLKVL